MKRYYLIEETDSNLRNIAFESRWYWAVKLYRATTQLNGEIFGPCRDPKHRMLGWERNDFKCSQCMIQRRFG